MLKRPTYFAAFAIAALAMPAAAQTQSWTYVSNTGGGKNALDLGSVTVENGIATFWTRSEFADPKMQQDWGGAAVQTREQMDCRGKRIRLLDYVTFDEAGSETSRETLNPPSDWVPVAPDTYAAEKYALLCKGR